ncbi:F-box/kelch-repeat protein At1g23390-like [Zingiber officinale]|uniref:F-box/kelch-repeat protein At1g23390-like n=1 Tax=Zingiber officinale TaxID=94328 RepID=UPI001C4ADFE6|nr:F-box/kelch-repeat protein At1g23390-like [Zingiber officinale]
MEMARNCDRETEEAEAGGGGRNSSIHGDVLEEVVSRVSALDLLHVSRVSRGWRTAAISSLLCRRRPPCLLLRLQSRRRASAHVYDPISGAWRDVPIPPEASLHGLDAPRVAALASSLSGGPRFYALSSSKLALAADPLGTAWRDLEPPRCWRTDPTVALVGTRLVVAGGGCALEGNAGSVEMCDAYGGGGGCWWEPCEAMPEAFRLSPAISAAASERRLYVVERQPPFGASWFDTETRRWGPTRSLSVPDPTARHVAIGFSNGRLLLAAAGGSGMGWGWAAESVRVWMVEEETLEVASEEVVAEMPREMVAALAEDGGGGWGLPSIGFLCESDFAYFYNPVYLKEFFLCEQQAAGGSGCRWQRVEPPACVEQRPIDKVALGCCQNGSRLYLS